MWPPGLFNAANADTSCAALLHLGNKFEKVHRVGALATAHCATYPPGTGPSSSSWTEHRPKNGKNNCAAKIGGCTKLIGAFRLSPVGSETESNLGGTEFYAALSKTSEDISVLWTMVETLCVGL